MKQQKQSFSAQIRKNVSLNYLLYLPKGYHDTSDTTWPLILFLHGMGERGEDLELVKKHGIPKVIEEKDDFPFVVISPQCPQHSVWPEQLDTLHALIEETIHTYRIDTSRIYLTGLSMGGFGSWHLAEAYPHLFAAVVPICGGTLPHVGFPERIKVLKESPIWVFHGAKDETVSLQMSQELVDVLKAHSGNVKFTIYPDAEHDSWTATYNNPELYDWLLEQKNDHFQL
jgi:predicted peptidase